MKNKTVTVPIEWFEGLKDKINNIDRTPHISSPAQSRNGIKYCSTCEQVWEDCSCPARNSGYSRAIRDVLQVIQSAEHIIKGGKDGKNDR